MPFVGRTSVETLSIGELSRRTGVNIETIRYYERVKMLPAPPRTSSGRRVYRLSEIRSLSFIRRSRELGFALDEIRALLAFSAEDGNNTCGEVRKVAEHHLADIRAKIADLRAMARVLSDAVKRCDAGEMPGCPLIDTLSASAPLHLVARLSKDLSKTHKLILESWGGAGVSNLCAAEGNVRNPSRTLPLDLGPANGRKRRISLVAGRPGESPLTEPHSRRSASAAGTALYAPQASLSEPP